MRRPVLVAGGAGYIGSHIVRRFLDADRSVVALDDLSKIVHRRPTAARFYQADIFDRALVESIIAKHGIDTIIHAATSHHPMRRLTSVATAFAGYAGSGVSKLIFTSSCAVYGASRAGQPVDETSTTAPISGYGSEKLALERMFLDLSKTTGLRCVVLRCFNVAGAYRAVGFSGSPGDPIRLINMACQVATGRRNHVPVYGSDLPTDDGTCVRDYVHVDDVAAAYVSAASYLGEGGDSVVLNCGSGRGHSIGEILRAVEIETGVAIPVELLPRRSQDVPFMVAGIDGIRETLGWAPRKSSLLAILRSTLACEHAT